jgi:gas vesicle protein
MEMASHDINDLLENISKELPGRARDAYEQAVKKALQRRHHRGGRNFGWEMIERGLPPMFQQRKQKQDEGLMPLFTLLIGFIGGAALMYLFDPDRGNRRRAMIQVEARKVTTNISDAVEDTAERIETEFNRVINNSEEEESQKGREAYTTTTGGTTPSSVTQPRPSVSSPASSATSAAAGQSRTPSPLVNEPATGGTQNTSGGQNRTPNGSTSETNPAGNQSPSVGTTRPPNSVTGSGRTDS